MSKKFMLPGVIAMALAFPMGATAGNEPPGPPPPPPDKCDFPMTPDGKCEPPPCDKKGLKEGDRCKPNPPCVKDDSRHMCKPDDKGEPPIIIILPGFDCAGLPVFPGDTPSLCPGTPGPPGDDGAPGADGAPGVDGAPGADGADGTNGVDGQDGQDGARGPRGPAGKPASSCTSRRVIVIHLPRSFDGQRAVVAFAGSKRRVLRVGSNRSVRVNFAGVKSSAGRGVAVAIWGRRLNGRRPHLTRIYSLCTERGVGQFNVPPARG